MYRSVNNRWIILWLFLTIIIGDVLVRANEEEEVNETTEFITPELEVNTDIDTNSNDNPTSTLISESEESLSLILTSPSDIYVNNYGINHKPTVQKCCPHHQHLVVDGTTSCADTNEVFLVDIFDFNQTHYWNYTNTLTADIIVKNPCMESKYFLDPENDSNDTFRLLKNGTLYIPEFYQILDASEYCMDIVHFRGSFLVTAVICTPYNAPDISHYFYGTGRIISLICLIILAIYSILRTDIEDDHKYCLAWFSAVRASSFFFTVLLTFFGNSFNETTCITIAYMLYFIYLNSYMWLNIVCYDTKRCIKYSDSPNKSSYITRYIMASLLLPLGLFLISLINLPKPAIPAMLVMYYNEDGGLIWCIVLFFAPIALSNSINIIWCTKISFPWHDFKDTRKFITQIMGKGWRPPPHNVMTLKNMYRRSFTLFSLMVGVLVLDLLMYCLSKADDRHLVNRIRDTVACLEGLFISLIFVRKEWFGCKRYNPPHEIHELAPMNNK